jgi:hypothetical protein
MKGESIRWICISDQISILAFQFLENCFRNSGSFSSGDSNSPLHKSLILLAILFQGKEMTIVKHLKLLLFDGVLQILALTYYYIPMGWSRSFIEKIYALKGIELVPASFFGRNSSV